MESEIQASDFNSKIRSTVLATIIHAPIPFFWIVLTLFIFPSFVASFIELGVEIPTLTTIIIKFSEIMSRYWFVYLFFILLLLVADGAVYFSLLRSSRKISASYWSILVLLAESIFTILYVSALCLPLMKIITSKE